MTRLTGEIADYAKDGFDLMIEQGWLEKVPEAPNHKNYEVTNENQYHK